MRSFTAKGLTRAASLAVLALGVDDVKSVDIELPPDTELTRQITSADLVTLNEIGGMSGTGLSVSPNGKYVAFEVHQADLAENGYRVRWVVASADREGRATEVADGGDPALFRSRLPNGRLVGSWLSEHPKWSPDSRGIAFRKKEKGETQIWWASHDGKDVRQLTFNRADVESFRWTEDGSKIVFETDADRTEIRKAERARYEHGHVFDYEKAWSTIDARPLYPRYAMTGGEARVWVFDVEAGLERRATADELADLRRVGADAVEPDAPRHARYTARRVPGSGEIAWLQPDNQEQQGQIPPLSLYASPTVGDDGPVRCAAPECTGIMNYYSPLSDVLQWNAVEGEIVFARSEGVGYSIRTLYGWRPGDAHVRRIYSTDKWLSDCMIVHGRALCFLETPTHPRTVVSIDLADGSMETLVDMNPDFRRVVLGDVTLIEWENSYGVGTFGYLVKPPGYVPGRRYPLVFVGYRARWALRGGVGEDYPVHLLAANGFVVVVYEKPTTYEAFAKYSDGIEIGKAMMGPDLFDVRMTLATFESAIDLLDAQGMVDKARVGVTGLSNGVSHASYALIHSNLFSAAITSSIEWAPSSYFLAGVSGEFIRAYRNAIGAGKHGGPHGFLWEHVALSLNTERVNAPLLVNVSDAEHPAALEDVVALIEDGKPVEMVVYPDEGHVKWQPAHRLSVYERNVDWLNYWLQGIEDRNPEKMNQYARWRLLRDKM